nr:lipoyl(octanoyl) transferase LipB [Marinibactrum halimedae]
MTSSVSGVDIHTVVIRDLGQQAYEPVWKSMLEFTDARDQHTQDEIWVVEHTPVFTQGQAGKAEHILAPGDIPVVQVDRGGQVTYHGPGQLVIYPLVDIRRKKMGVRELVTAIETSIVETLCSIEVTAYPKADAPGVYVQHNNHEHKIASLGLRVRKGSSFHGLALNVAMDLSPFSRINPCGYAGMPMSQVQDVMPSWQSEGSFQQVKSTLIRTLMERLGFTDACHESIIQTQT